MTYEQVGNTGRRRILRQRFRRKSTDSEGKKLLVAERIEWRLRDDVRRLSEGCNTLAIHAVSIAAAML